MLCDKSAMKRCSEGFRGDKRDLMWWGVWCGGFKAPRRPFPTKHAPHSLGMAPWVCGRVESVSISLQHKSMAWWMLYEMGCVLVAASCLEINQPRKSVYLMDGGGSVLVIVGVAAVEK